MSKSDPPQPPNPQATAAAQTGTNVSTAVANAFLNNTNQTTPLGSLSYDPTGSFSWSDPTTGQTYNIPRFTATQTLGPVQQQTQNQQELAKQNLATLANTQSTRLQGALAGNIDLSNASQPGAAWALSNMPGADANLHGEAIPISYDLGPYTDQQFGFGDAGQQTSTFGAVNPLAYSLGDAGGQQTQFGGTPGSVFGFGGAGDVTRNYGPQDDFSSDRQRVEQSLFSRLSPQLERERTNLEQRLADQGIRYGSTAYNDAMKDYNDRAAAQQVAVTQAGGAEQQRMMDMAAQRAGFQNAAQQQEYQQQLGRGTFYNAAEQQAFQEAQQRGAFANEAQQRAYQELLSRGQFGNAAQQQQFAQAQARGTFANQAQQSLYEQLQGRGTFANTAAAQQYQQALGAGQFRSQQQQNAWTQAALRGQFANQANAQNYTQAQSVVAAQNAARAQYLQEQYALRNQPINETSALLSGSQVQQPTFMQTPQQQIPTTDIAGIINQNFQQQFQNYQQQQQAQNQLLGGALGAAGSIGAGFAFRSDRRAKEDITRVGSVFAMEPNTGAGERKVLPMYEYSYKDDAAGTRHVGPMAQDVAKIDKGAVTTIGGVKHIYPERVMGAILRAA